MVAQPLPFCKGGRGAKQERRRCPMQPDTTQTDTIRLLKKQLFFTRLIALLLAVTMAVLLATAAILLPQAQDILKDVNTVSRQLAAVDWARMAQEIENLALTSRESMAEVLLQVQKLDLDTLNETIQDFNEILTPLASFFGG